MYELYDPCTTMFFFRNKHIMVSPRFVVYECADHAVQVDLGTGNNNKINWALNVKQEIIDIIEMVYKGAKKGGCGTLRSCATQTTLCRARFGCQPKRLFDQGLGVGGPGMFRRLCSHSLH